MLTDADIKHLQKVNRYYKLSKADYKYAGLKFHMQDNTYNQDYDNCIEVVENLPAKINRVFSQLMFLEKYAITIDRENEEQNTKLHNMLNRNKFHTKLIQSAQDQSRAGYAAFELSLVDGEVLISLLKPDYVFIHANPMSPDLPPKEIIIGWYIEKQDHNGNPIKYLFTKTHTKETITCDVYDCDPMGKPVGKPKDPNMFGVDVERVQRQFEQGIPVFVINNDLIESGSVYGTSDFESNESLFQELARNMTQIANELYQFGNAMLAVPEGVLKENGRPKKRSMKMIQIDSEENTFIPQYIVNNNPQIDKAQAHTEHILRAICRSTDIAELLVGLNTQGGAEKVGALRLRLLLTLARVKSKLISYHDVLPSMIAFAEQLEGRQIEAGQISFKFNDGLPEDMVEKVDLEVKRYAGGLQTLDDAIKNLDNLEPEALAEKVESIREVEESESFAIQTP